MAGESGMDQCERWAKDYLKFAGIPEDDIVFEPNGPKIFPDFAIGGRIGIEVRRLNQHVEDENGDWEAIEKLSRPLERRLSALVQSFGPAADSRRWWLYYRFRRPQITKRWEELLERKLTEFLNAPNIEGKTTISIDQNFNLSLSPRRSYTDRVFTLVGRSDWDSGGWTDIELQKNLAICIEEKTRKREAFRSLFPEWWLILVDHFNGGEPGNVDIFHDWTKVLVIHPESYARAYQVPSRRKIQGG